MSKVVGHVEQCHSGLTILTGNPALFWKHTDPPTSPRRKKNSLQIILETIRTFTPHMKGFFVLEDTWWVQNADKPSLHMRPILKNCYCTTSHNEPALDI